jgi:predicted AAA+ superfamily ATPase
MPPKSKPSTSTSLEELILERLDTAALMNGLIDHIATKIASDISLEELAEQFLERKRTELSASLADHILKSVFER